MNTNTEVVHLHRGLGIALAIHHQLRAESRHNFIELFNVYAHLVYAARDGLMKIVVIQFGHAQPYHLDHVRFAGFHDNRCGGVFEDHVQVMGLAGGNLHCLLIAQHVHPFRYPNSGDTFFNIDGTAFKRLFELLLGVIIHRRRRVLDFHVGEAIVVKKKFAVFNSGKDMGGLRPTAFGLQLDEPTGGIEHPQVRSDAEIAIRVHLKLFQLDFGSAVHGHMLPVSGENPVQLRRIEPHHVFPGVRIPRHVKIAGIELAECFFQNGELIPRWLCNRQIT